MIDNSKSVRWFSMKCNGEVTNIRTEVNEAIRSGKEWISGIGSKTFHAQKRNNYHSSVWPKLDLVALLAIAKEVPCAPK